MQTQHVDRGKPADYGQEIVKRRYRLTTSRISLQGKTVLDFGCGNGAQTSQLLAGGCRIVAVDIDLADLQVLAGYLRSNEISDALPVQYDGSRLPLGDASVDVVISFEVLEHVQSEATALGEIGRVLKPGGNLILSVPNKWWIFETHGARLPLLSWNRVPFFSWLPASIHSRFARARIYRRRQIVSMLEASGFTVLESVYVTAPLDVVKSLRVKEFLRGLAFAVDESRNPFVSTAIFVHAVKN